jgi:hypothetical protein
VVALFAVFLPSLQKGNKTLQIPLLFFAVAVVAVQVCDATGAK